MIERIVGRLFKHSNITTLNRFWASDNFKGGKGGRGGFFGRKNKQPEEEQPYESREVEAAKEPSHKTVRFLKKNELMMKNIQPNPKRQLRFRKRQTFQQAQTQKPAPFVKPEKEDNEQQLIKKSIFFSRSSPAPKSTQQTQNRFSDSQPQLNQYLNSPAPQNKFYDKLSEDLDKIFALFEDRNWKQLNEIVQDYYQMTPAQDIEKELHSLLINADAGRYVEWIKNVGRTYDKGFSEATLKKLYNGLVSQYRVKELKELLSFFKSKCFNVEYKSIDILLADLEKDSPLKGLQQKVSQKVDILLDILAAQLKYNQKHQSQETVSVYTLDEWFNTLAHLALSRQVSKGKFKALFEEIFIKHYEYINLEHVYSSGLFLDTIEHYYFGSYVTTAKLQAIFMDMLHSNIDLQSELVRLRNKLIAYRIKNGKFAFPNVRRLQEQFQNHFSKEHFEPAVFFFMLLSFSDEKVDKQWLMEKRRILINVGQQQYDIRELFNDPLWALENKLLESRPAQTQSSQAEAPSSQAEAQSSQAEAQSSQAEAPAEEKETNQQAAPVQEEQQAKTEQQQTSFSKKKNLQGQNGTSWKDVKYNRYRYQERAKRLGWTHYKQFGSYYATLKREMEAEGNPYRKQLLQNIILAKLNLETDVYIAPELPSASADKFIEEEFDKLKASSAQSDEQFDEKLDEELAAYQEEDEDYRQQKYLAKIKELQNKLEQDEDTPIERFEDPELHQRTLEYLGDAITADMHGPERDKRRNVEMAIRKLNRQQFPQNFQEEEFQQFDEDMDDFDQEFDIPIDLVAARRKKYDFDNLTALKSAIKLKKYELALGLCEKIYMEPLMLERTAKNIAMVVKSFLIEEHARNQIPDVEELLEQVDAAVYNLSDEYLRSVYDRCDSFDELIWNYSPPKEHKFRYWETALTMARGQQLVEMDISNQLSTMKYEPEYDTLPVSGRDEFITRNSENWRESLMAELGILRPLKDQTEEVILQPYANDQEFFQKFLKEDIFPQEDADIIKEAQAELGLYDAEAEPIEGQEGAVEADEAAVEGEAVEGEAVEGEAVEGEAAEGEAAEGEAVQQGEVAAESQEAVEGEGEAAEQAGGSAAVEQSAAEAVQEQAHEEVPQQELEGEQQAQQHPPQADIFATNILFGPSNFDISAETRVRGYDFNQFLDMARKRIKPMLQEFYEQEKEYKKHVINLHSLSEQAMMEDIHYLQRKLFEYQRYVKSISNIAIFMSFGLWDYKFSDYAFDPQLAKATAREFRQKFHNFKKYEGKKGNDSNIILDNEKYVDISERVDMIYNLEFSEAMIDDLLVRRHRFFKQAEAVVKLPPSPVVEELILWGLRADEPMAIYLAEKIAMLTNQIVSHQVATQVGTYLSHRRQIPAERIERCKEALKVVGRINRDNIYDFQQEYQHITNRKHFKEYLQKRSAELDSSALEFLARVDPTHNHQQEIFNLKENLTRGKLVV